MHEITAYTQAGDRLSMAAPALRAERRRWR